MSKRHRRPEVPAHGAGLDGPLIQRPFEARRLRRLAPQGDGKCFAHDPEHRVGRRTNPFDRRKPRRRCALRAIAAAAQTTRIPVKSANTIAREFTMTAITGHIAPEAKDGDLGVHSLDQFVLQVPDASKAEEFYGNFGLDVRRDGSVLAIKTFGHDHRWGSVVEGAKQKALHHLSFGCYAEDFPRLKARIEGEGIKLVDAPRGFQSNGIWFRNHEGVLMEIKVAPKVSPDAKADSQFITEIGRASCRERVYS